MSQAVGIRVVKRLSELLGPTMRTDICVSINQIGNELWEDASNSLGRRDYVESKKDVDELVFLARVQEQLCPARGIMTQSVMVTRRKRRKARVVAE